MVEMSRQDANQALFTELEKQKLAFQANPYLSVQARKQHLLALSEGVKRYQTRLCEALSADFSHRSQQETLMLEVFPVFETIRYVSSRLQRWMKPERRSVSLWFKPSQARVMAQPKGVVGIIVPWNYPVSLALIPVIYALAAGNRVLVKLPEATPKTSFLLADLLHEVFPEEEVVAFSGGPEVGAEFSRLAFDHLFFTGSTTVGKKVLQAASANLTPVTLELGGKSPTIIGRNYPLEKAVERIWLGKLLNAGQTCVAPDYVFLPQELIESFIQHSRAIVQKFYPQSYFQQDYSCIVDEKNFARLTSLLDEAVSLQVAVHAMLPNHHHKEHARCLNPMIVVDPPENLRLMQEEIFGPILPVKPYKVLDDALQYINAKPRPLAMYYFDEDKANINKVLKNTHAGGVTINHTVLHVAQDDLPFGGIGKSGMGSYHGKEGFDTFSHKKSIFYQSKLNTAFLLQPPYTAVTNWLIKLMLRQ